jgi:hypothetical protein
VHFLTTPVANPVAKFESNTGTQINDECGLAHAGDDLPGLKWTARLLDLGRARAFSDAAILQGNGRLDEKPAREFRLYQELGKIRVS